MRDGATRAQAAPRLGRYAIGRRIGTGGMAVVDAACQSTQGGGRLVALKRISSALSSDPSARRLFLREASIVTRIEHPNVVRTYEVGEADGEAFIAMELLEGANVAELQRASAGGVPLPIALRIVGDALLGLHAAHELCAPGGEPLGLVHLDVSPQNLHVAYEGTTRILDFGVARLAALDATRTDTIRGKAYYLAPEQVTLGPVDRRTDLFAVGIVLHELLTGVPLFPRARAEVAHMAILAGDVPSARSIRAEVPEAIDAVVRRALAVAPDGRFATAKEMRGALLAAQERAGVGVVDIGAVAAWVQEMAPPAWTRTEIERDLHLGTLGATAMDVELPTLPPRRAARTAADAERRPWFALPLVAVVGVLAVGGLLVRARPAPIAEMPLLQPSSLATPAAPPPPPPELAPAAPPPASAAPPASPAAPSVSTPHRAEHSAQPRALAKPAMPPVTSAPAAAPPPDPLSTQ